MAKQYTAEEMRQMAGSIVYERSVEYFPDVEKIAAMLRQAADDMAREKKYEYSVKEFGGYVQPLHEDSVSSSFLDGRAIGDENYVIVRREVGEWEEVDDA